MRKNNKFNLAFLICTLFGVGKAPFAPGTMGSLFTAILFLLTSDYLILHIVLVFPIIYLGIYYSEIYMKQERTKHDPKEIVIDEYAGQMLAIFITIFFAHLILSAPSSDIKLNFTNPGAEMVGFDVTSFSVGLSFLLFRAFDVLKPFPISWIDAHIKGGWGVMADDISAGIAAGFASALVFLAL